MARPILALPAGERPRKNASQVALPGALLEDFPVPYIETSSYCPPFGFGNGHLQTIYPALFRRVPRVAAARERIETPDGDFLDLDWSARAGRRRSLVVISHGLEGDSSQAYVQGMAGAFLRRGWDALAWNFRGCSGEPNRRARFYHSGATEDLGAVLTHVFATRNYAQVALVGFSLGGNMTLKYLGDLGDEADSRLCGAVAFSVPCDLASSAEKLAGFSQRLYMRRFLKGLRGKIRKKMESHPQEVTDEGFDRVKNFHDFDGAYTAPLHGFESAEDYWERCSCRRVLEQIRVPALLVNAVNDPFLGSGCFPREEAKASEHFFFEAPRGGGHVGFVSRDRSGEYWSESRAAEFFGS
ncbi:MAG: YheT family hydrolase [Verrucomicrobiales bacterium]